MGLNTFADPAPGGSVILSPAHLAGWQERSFEGHTIYRAEEGGLHAIADGTASGLCLQANIDLRATPVATWRWRLDRAPPRSDERAKEGDDQGLRIGFLHVDDEMPEGIISVQYVWSQSEPAGTVWPNPYVPSAMQVAAHSGPARPGEWVGERRDLKADFRTAFGRDIDHVDAVCLMTDGDQTGALVEGWYGDITLQNQ